MGKKWILAQPLPVNSFCISRDHDGVAHTIYNRNLFLLNGQNPSLYCNLDFLLATASLGSFKMSANYVWRKFAVPTGSCHLLLLGNCLTVAGNIHPSIRITMGLCGTINAAEFE